MRFDQAGPARVSECRVRIGMDVEYVLSLKVVNIAAIRKIAVKEQKAQIGDAGFGKCRQTDEVLQLHLRTLVANHVSGLRCVRRIYTKPLENAHLEVQMTTS